MSGKSKAYATAFAAAIALGCGVVHGQQSESENEDTTATREADDESRTAERLDDIVRMAEEAIEELRERNPTAAREMEQAYGYAVFDTTQGGLILTGAGGTGVARPFAGGDVTFMRVGAAGVGIGVGFQNYRLVLLIADEQTYRDFVSGLWDGNLSAHAVAGDEGVAAVEQFLGGIRAYRLTDGGLMAQVDAIGQRFWPADALNDAAELRELRAAAGRAPPEESETVQVAEAEPETETEPFAESETEPSAEAEAEAEAAAVETGEPHPERLDELAAEHEDLGTFIAAVQAAGMADALTGDVPYTLLAPTNEAFESTSGMTREELLAPENRAELVRLLRAHIIADDMDRQMAENLSEARTIDGGTVPVDMEGERFSIGDATVVEPDIESGNLRVQVIDEVLGRGRTQVAAAPENEIEPDSESEPEDAEGAPEIADPQDAAEPQDTAEPQDAAEPADEAEPVDSSDGAGAAPGSSGLR